MDGGPCRVGGFFECGTEQWRYQEAECYCLRFVLWLDSEEAFTFVIEVDKLQPQLTLSNLDVM